MTMIFTDRPSDSSFVETIWHARSEQAGSFISLAASTWELVVTRYQGNTTVIVRGPETWAMPLQYRWTGAEWLGIRFKLGTFMPHLPPGHLRDRKDVHLLAAADRFFWLHGSTWEIPTFENAEAFVDRLVRAGVLVRDPVVEAAVRGHPPMVSPRTLQQHFARATGLTYKTIRQIERARHAQALLEHGVSILDTVGEAGYFDQAHLTNSLKRFLGQTPAHIARGRRPE
jgi:hypothetical protein